MGVKVREWDGGRGGKLAWWIFIDHQRKRKAKKIGTGPEAKKQAEEAARVIEARLVMGDLGVFEPPPVALTLEQFSELWRQDYVQRNLRHTTSEKYEEVLRLHWLPKLGQLPLRKLSRQHIRNAVKAFHREGLSNSTIRWFLNVIQSCLASAVEDGHLAANPAVKSTKWLLRATTTTNKRQLQTVFSAAEIKLLLQHAAHRTPMTHAMVFTLARTGLHISELMGLRVEDLDFERREIHVRRTGGNHARGPGYYGGIKNSQARIVDMSLQPQGALRSWVATLSEGQGWLFPAKHGRPMTPNSFYTVHWWPLFDDELLKYRKPHMLRYTRATHLLWQDESPVYVKEQLGHSSIRMTVDIYGSSIRRDNKRAVDRLDESVEASGDIRTPGASNTIGGLRIIQGGAS
jgi:integrase